MAKVPQKKNSLGKGLGALLQGSYQDVQNKEPQELEIQINSIAEISIENIERMNKEFLKAKL